MSEIVLLDSGPVGLLTRRTGIPASDECRRWQRGLLAQGTRVVLPEIVDYEVSRELVRLNNVTGLARLDHLAVTLTYLPITTAAMKQAAQLWAMARRQGQPTADPEALDGDVILAAQATMLDAPDVVVATSNVGHLSQFVTAKAWQDI